MGWVWGLGSAGTPAAETESLGRSLGWPEPDMEKAEGSFQKCCPNLPGLPSASGWLPSAGLAWAPHLSMWGRWNSYERNKRSPINDRNPFSQGVGKVTRDHVSRMPGPVVCAQELPDCSGKPWLHPKFPPLSESPSTLAHRCSSSSLLGS